MDAFVADERGDPVPGLTREDFQVFEEGVLQEISAFAEVVVPVEREGTKPGEGTPWPHDVATNETGVRGRIYALVLDELHTDARRAGAVRGLARQFIERHMAANDVAAVVLTGGRTDAAQAFTGNKRLLLEAVDRFAARKLRSVTLERLDTMERQRDLLAAEAKPPPGAPPPPEVALAPRPGVERDPWDPGRVHDARASMETLARVARGFGEIEGRRKAILLFSEGIDYDTLDVMGAAQRNASEVRASVKEAILTAMRNSVAVYTVDPRGSVDAGGPEDIEMAAPARGAAFGIDSRSLAREVRLSQDSLRTLAEQTGGIAAVDTNDFAAAYDRTISASSRYYLLGYRPAEFRLDGAYRRIEVRIARRGVSVVSRKGYVRPRARKEEGAQVETAAAPETSPELRALLDSPWPQPGLTLRVTTAAFKGDGGDATVVVTIELPGDGSAGAGDQGRAGNEIEVSFVALDARGKVRAGERLLATSRASAPTPELAPGPGLRFVRKLRLPPGRYHLRVAAREKQEGRRGAVSHDLEVPDFAEPRVAMSGVLVTSRRTAHALTPSVDDSVRPILETPPTATRRFEPGDVVTAYAEVYDAREPAHDVAIAARVTSVDGREVFRSTRLRASSELEKTGGGFKQEVEIPLADLSPGGYLLQVTARPTFGEDTASRELSFEVVSPAARPASGAAPAPPRGTGGLRPASRIDRLAAWLAAVERHEPGTADEPALTVRSWTPADLLELATDVAVVVTLIDDPRGSVMWVVDPSRPGRPQRAPYSADDERRLRALAGQAATHCPGPCARNRLLKRGAVLHTDAAIRFEATVGRLRGSGDPRPDHWSVPFSDGQALRTEEAPGQWELARALLDNVAPDPGRDETVRLWYLATTAQGQYRERYTRLEERAVQLFPEDANLLLLAGSLHEAFALPRIQSLTRSIRLPAGTSLGMGSDGSERREAEKLLRRALAVEPGLAEARIRLGRVLFLQGRHELAARELRQVAAALSSPDPKAAADDGLLLYYAEMFRGAAEEALGRYDPARVSYARAAVLYPDAPSPRLALSQLALRGHDRAAALAAMQRALRPPAGPEDPDDPWWRYHKVQGRGADAWFSELYGSLGTER